MASKSRPRSKVLQLYLVTGSPWHWSSDVYEDVESDREGGEPEEKEGSSATSPPSTPAAISQTTSSKIQTDAKANPVAEYANSRNHLRGQSGAKEQGHLLVTALRCASDTVVLAGVLETLPNALCLLSLQRIL